VITVYVLHLSCNVVNGLLCCDVVMLLQRIFCGVVSCVCVCVCVALRMYGAGGSHCIKTFFTDVDVVDIIMRLSTSCPSCRHHVMSCDVMSA
jgi:hypothetical protein